MTTTAAGKIESALAGLAEGFRKGLPQRLQAVLQRCAQLELALPDAARAELREAVLFDLHKLAGSAASFGMAELADAARLAWLRLHGAGSLDAERRACTQIRTLLATQVGTQAAETLTLVAMPPEEARLDGHGVLVISQRMEGWEVLAARLAELGQVELGVQSGNVVVGQPELVLVDMDSSAGVSLDERLERVRRCVDQKYPVYGVSRDDSFEMRLLISRAGGAGLLAWPVTPEAVLHALGGVRERQRQQPVRVLVVDDAPELAELYQVILEAAGMEVFVEPDPVHVLNALNRYRPELLLIDQHMPRWRGEDVAATIRSYAEFTSLPIIFLSGEHDRERQLFALTHGQAEDFLVKPVAPERLVAVVLNRAMRFRALRRLMAADSLTGLYNHAAILQELDNDLARARRMRRKLAVAMVDIDHFKQVNDRWGHPAGDEVLRSLAELMRARVRAGDSIGRYGGEEFMVIMPDTDIVGAMRLMEELRLSFASLWHTVGKKQFHCSFSCGIAGFPGTSQSARLVELADRALYRAKAAGRNQVLVDWKQFGLTESK